MTFVTGAGVNLEGNGDMNAGTGWKYNKDTGEFMCNHADWDEYQCDLRYCLWRDARNLHMGKLDVRLFG